MQACTKRARASWELLRSEVVSPCWWVERASAMARRMAVGLRGPTATMVGRMTLFALLAGEKG